MTTPAEVHAAAERARWREVSGILERLRTGIADEALELLEAAAEDEGATETLAFLLHDAGLRVAATPVPAALPPWKRALLGLPGGESAEDIADRLLAALRRDDGSPATVLPGGEDAELTVTVTAGGTSRTWRVPATREGVTFETRLERDDVVFEVGRRPEGPPRVLSWSCVPLPSADGVEYTVTDDPPPPPPVRAGGSGPVVLNVTQGPPDVRYVPVVVRARCPRCGL